MTGENSAVDFVVDDHRDFLHRIKGLVSTVVETTEQKRNVGLRCCDVILTEGVGLMFSEDDLPDENSRQRRSLFYIDARLLANQRGISAEYLKDPDAYGGEASIIDEFYEAVTRITDRAVGHYTHIMSAVVPDFSA